MSLLKSDPTPRTGLPQASPQTFERLEILDVHSLHKSGTMFLFRFFEKLASEQGYQFISENNATDDSNFKSYGNLIPNGIAEQGNKICRAPIRSFELGETRVVGSKQKRIFHLRDPRDILVSEYFSFGWIHPDERAELSARRLEIQEMTVDDYVLRQAEESPWPVDQKYAPLVEYEFDPENELVVKYEQMVTSFIKWCHSIVKFMGLRNSMWTTSKLAWHYRKEFRKPKESMTHKRRITPGDHADKLKPQTIDLLNQRFEKVLLKFGYLK